MFSLTTPLQLLSRVSQTSAAVAQVGLQTPAGKVHFQAPAWQATVTPEVHSAAEAVGLTPQICDGVGATTASSIWPLQLSSAPLQASCAETNVHA